MNFYRTTIINYIMLNKLSVSARRFLLFLLVFGFPAARAQQPRDAKTMDSLVNSVSTATDDTNKVNLLATIAMAYANNDPKKGLVYGGLAIELSKKLEWKKGLASGYNTLGASYKSLSEYQRPWTIISSLWRSMKS